MKKSSKVNTTDASGDWINSVKEYFTRLSETRSPTEKYSLLQAGLQELERRGAHPPHSETQALKFIEYSMEAYKHSHIVSAHHALLAGVLKKARRHAINLGDERSAAILDLQLGKVLLILNRLEESRRVCARGLTAVDALGDKELAEYAGRFLILYHTLQGKPLKVLETYKDIRTSLDADSDPFVVTHIIPLVALSAAFLGQFRLGKRLLINGWRTAQTHGYTTAEKSLETTLGLLLVAAGDLKQARVHIDSAIGASEESYASISEFWAKRNKAYLLFAEGHLQESYEQMLQARTNADRKGLHSGFYFVPWMLEMLWAFHRAGFSPIPGFEYQREIQRITDGGNVHLRGVAYRFKALDAGWKQFPIHDQLALLQRSEELLLSVSGEMELAKTWIEIARIHLQQGAVDLAGPTIAKAWAIYERSAPDLFPEELHRWLEPASELPKEESIWPTYDRLMDLLERLPVPLDRHDLFSRLVGIACSFFGAEQGGLFVRDAETGSIALESAFNIKNFHQNKAHEKFALELIGQAIQEEVAVVRGTSQHRNESPTALCVPLSTMGEKRALLLESSITMDIFHELPPHQILQLSSLVGRQLSMLINILEVTENDYRKNLGQAIVASSAADTNLRYQSNTMDRVVHVADMAAESDASVVILGETGVGKEVLALHIHRQSKRRQMPFVPIDLSCLSESLIESEMFGHEKGAFTGANEQKAGLIELADKGTLFIDEIGDSPLSTQLKLLRLLQEKTFRRVGGTKVRHSDFRLIVATNKDLQSAIRSGGFREDLYYRLNVISISVPPLRQREDDIIYLSEHFLIHFSKKYRKPVPVLTLDHKRCLTAYSWPGNIRELKNLMERVIVLQDDSLLYVAQGKQATYSLPSASLVDSEPAPTLDEIQIAHISEILKLTKGKIAGKNGAAGILGLKRSTLYNRMKKLGMHHGVFSIPQLKNEEGEKE